MTGQRTGPGSATAGFEAAWCATGLGEHRHCRYTHASYPYASPPPPDSGRYTDRFDRLGPVGPRRVGDDRGGRRGPARPTDRRDHPHRRRPVRRRPVAQLCDYPRHYAPQEVSA